MRTAILIVLTFSTLTTLSQDLKSIKTLDSDSTGLAYTLFDDVSSEGDYIACGLINGKIDIDPDPTVDKICNAFNYYDYFLSKYNSKGELLWSQFFVTTVGSFEPVSTVGVDNNGDILVAGHFKYSTSVFDLDPDPNTIVIPDTSEGLSYIAKYAGSDGSLMWYKQFESSSVNCYFTSITFGSNNDIYLGGIFSDTLDCDPAPATSSDIISDGKNDIFIINLKPNGKYNISKKIGGPEEDYLQKMEFDSQGQLVIAGTFQKTCNLDKGNTNKKISAPTTPLNTNVFVAKYDGNMGFIKALNLGNTANEKVVDMILDKYDNIYLAGMFGDSLTLKSASATRKLTAEGYAQNAYLTKWNSSLQNLWGAHIAYTDSATNNYLGMLSVDASQRVYLTGSYQDSVYFTDTSKHLYPEATNTNQIFLASYESDGKIHHTQELTSTGGSSSTGLFLLPDDMLLATGSFIHIDLPVDGVDQTFDAKGFSSFYLTYLETWPVATQYIDESSERLVAYPNPTRDFIYLSTDQSPQTTQIIDVAGRVLHESKYESRIDLRALPMGNYVLRVRDAEDQTRSTVITKL